MPLIAKICTATASILLVCLAAAYFFKNEGNATDRFSNTINGWKEAEDPIRKAKLKSVELSQYASAHGYNQRIYFMVDMAIPSGKPRFFVYDVEKAAVVMKGLVTHGMGGSGSGIEYSNIPGSNCTSKGKYKIGAPYMGRFGLAYKLHGLEKTNSNAYARFVVLHAHDCVPDTAVYPMSICESLGCPTVSPGFLKSLAGYIDRADKPVLLCVYD